MAKSNPRRAIIREWTSLACEKRQSTQQASALAGAALQRHRLPRTRRALTTSSWHGCVRASDGLEDYAWGGWRELESRRTDAFRSHQKPEIR